jgi:hypothetical protein
MDLNTSIFDSKLSLEDEQKENYLFEENFIQPNSSEFW